MKHILMALVVLTGTVALSSCAKPATTMHNDWRTGTDYTPYRTVPASIQCDDCSY